MSPFSAIFIKVETPKYSKNWVNGVPKYSENWVIMVFQKTEKIWVQGLSE